MRKDRKDRDDHPSEDVTRSETSTWREAHSDVDINDFIDEVADEDEDEGPDESDLDDGDEDGSEDDSDECEDDSDANEEDDSDGSGEDDSHGEDDSDDDDSEDDDEESSDPVADYLDDFIDEVGPAFDEDGEDEEEDVGDDEPEEDVEQESTSVKGLITAAPTEATWESLRLSGPLFKAVKEIGYARPTAVQAATFGPAFSGNDLIVRSKTGTGKTAAFLMPLMNRLEGRERQTKILVLTPTRELAIQVAEEAESLGRHLDINVASLYGGVSLGPQTALLDAGAEVVVGSPGRVLDHIRRRNLDLSRIATVVLDEADEMLSMGFYEEVTTILEQCPKNTQFLLFSASVDPSIAAIIRRYLHNPQEILLSTDVRTVEGITHLLYPCSDAWPKARSLLYVLYQEQPDSAIIFCNTRADTSFLASYLTRQGFDAEAISSDLQQKDRERVMSRIKRGDLQFLVATDLASRGIDITNLSHVINYDLPEDPNVYLHRVGRTGRAGKLGTAVSMSSGRDLTAQLALERQLHIPFQARQLPTPEDAARVFLNRRLEALRQLRAGTAYEAWVPMAQSMATELAAEERDGIIAALLRFYFHWSKVAERVDSVEAPVEEAPPAEPGPRFDRGARRGRGRDDRRSVPARSEREARELSHEAPGYENESRSSEEGEDSDRRRGRSDDRRDNRSRDGRSRDSRSRDSRGSSDKRDSRGGSDKRESRPPAEKRDSRGPADKREERPQVEKRDERPEARDDKRETREPSRDEGRETRAPSEKREETRGGDRRESRGRDGGRDSRGRDNNRDSRGRDNRSRDNNREPARDNPREGGRDTGREGQREGTSPGNTREGTPPSQTREGGRDGNREGNRDQRDSRGRDDRRGNMPGGRRREETRSTPPAPAKPRPRPAKPAVPVDPADIDLSEWLDDAGDVEETVNRGLADDFISDGDEGEGVDSGEGDILSVGADGRKRRRRRRRRGGRRGPGEGGPASGGGEGGSDEG